MRALALFMACLAIACDGGGPGNGPADGGSGDASQPPPIPVAEFPARFATEWCGLLARCCAVSGGTAVTSCEADTQARIAAIGTKAAADGAIWAPTVAGACVAAIAAADCALVDAVGVRDVLDACDDTWTGVVPPGGTCMTYASCIQPEVAGASTGASCVNQACVQIVRLPVGASCAGASATVNCDPYVAECVGGTCVALPGVGDACTSSCVNADCDGSGQCVARLGMGEVCGGDSACASGKCSAGHCASVFAADSDTCTLP